VIWAIVDIDPHRIHDVVMNLLRFEHSSTERALIQAIVAQLTKFMDAIQLAVGYTIQTNTTNLIVLLFKVIFHERVVFVDAFRYDINNSEVVHW
jgi:hypothetical protein